MSYFSIFDTSSTPVRDRKRRYFFLLVNAIVLSWVVWSIVNFRNYAALPQDEVLKEILTDMLENVIEAAVLVTLSILYCKIIFRIFWGNKRTLNKLFFQVITLAVFNVLTSLAIGWLYSVIYPGDEGIMLRIFISDFTVVSILSTTYFVSFLISRHRDEKDARLLAEKKAAEEKLTAAQAKLDKLALQTNNHFIFNSFSTLGGMIKTQPDDAEKFLQGLSAMYRYLVRNADRHLIPLKDEIRFTENYATLVHYRYDGVRIEIDDSLRKTDALVTPVSIQQLVENAVKHNRHGDEEQLLVEVFRIEDYIVVRNNILELSGKEAGSTGFGLKNLADRIRLIVGKDIIADNDGTTFTVRIPLIYEEDLKDESMDY